MYIRYQFKYTGKADIMLDILPRIRQLVAENKELAIATVIKTWRSSPRQPGACLIVTADGTMVGSVSGGCVENAVVAKAQKALKNGAYELAKFGVANEDAWEVGLSCGGEIWVNISPFFSTDIWNTLNEKLLTDKGVSVLTNLSNFSHTLVDSNGGVITGARLTGSLLKEVSRTYSIRTNTLFNDDGEDYFIQNFPPRKKMLLIGSAHITVELTSLAKLYDFETIVIDPRDTFAHKTDYISTPDVIHVNWPQEVLNKYKLDQDTYAVILSHDPKIDDEALKILLPSNVRYIGALGSRKTHAKRIDRLKGLGFDDEIISRVNGPIGLDIGAMSANEIALSIMAEVIKAKNTTSEYLK